MNETQTPRREVIDNPEGTVTEYSDFEPTEAEMQRLADLLFKEHWGEITVGPCIQGAVFEIRFKDPPKVSLFDGYLTVDLGHWHFHLCIGTHQGTPSPELAAKRRVARAAFFETRGGKCGGGRSWWLRLWNGFRVSQGIPPRSSILAAGTGVPRPTPAPTARRTCSQLKVSWYTSIS
jgi:hypothetical protein